MCTYMARKKLFFPFFLVTGTSIFAHTSRFRRVNVAPHEIPTGIPLAFLPWRAHVYIVGTSKYVHAPGRGAQKRQRHAISRFLGERVYVSTFTSDGYNEKNNISILLDSLGAYTALRARYFTFRELHIVFRQE